MARKNLLKSLMEETQAPAPAEKDAPETLDPARPRRGTGAIGAVSQSIADLKNRSIHEIDPDLIDNAGFEDRLDTVDDDLAALVNSIREYGQQVPVLLRPHPEAGGRYQVVYGRRRVAAVRKAGGSVKAMLRDLDDRDLAIAQGQENSARKDLSFIEKANFARQLADAGFDRKTICDALHIDKTVISRMFSVVERVPYQWIRQIGAAPSVGRDRWLELAERIDLQEAGQDTLSFDDADLPSDARFERVFKSLAPAPAAAKAPKAAATRVSLVSATGENLGEARRAGKKVTLSLNTETADGFEDWLISNLTEIHRNFLESKGDSGE